MDKRFLTAFLVPERWNISGYWLAPYCIDHSIKLQGLGHPLLKGEIPNPAELMLFLRVCHEKRHNFYNLSPHIVDKMFVWKMQRNTDFYRFILESVMQYIQNYSSIPKVVSKDGLEKVENIPDVPELLSLVGTLLCKTSLTEREILTMPIGKAVWYSVIAARLEGADVKTISTEIEERADEQRAKAQEQVAKMKEQLRLAMVNGKLPKQRIK